MNGGDNWTMLSGGVPTIPFRDLKLHRRDDDLVGASFGRGFYVLDDYSPLREIAAGALDGDSQVSPVRDAWWYVPSVPGQARGRPTQGSTAYTAPNPPFGATFTYFLTDAPVTARELRRATERERREVGEDVPFPGYETLRLEAAESDPMVLLVVRDALGEAVRWVEGTAKPGMHRVTWDLRRPPPDPIELSTPGFTPPWARPPQGPLAPPGQYSVKLLVISADGAQLLGSAQQFDVRAVPTVAPGTDLAVVAEFQHQASDLMRRIAAAGAEMRRARERLRHMRAALVETPRADPALFGRMDELVASLDDLQVRLSGDPARQRLSQSMSPSIRGRVGQVIGGHWPTRQAPTATQRSSLELASEGFEMLSGELSELIEVDLARLEADLAAAGAPWTPGRRLSTQ